MILVDTSIWIDHLRHGDRTLIHLLEEGTVCTHPMVIGEVALGNLHDRQGVVQLLGQLPDVVEARHDECLHLIESAGLWGRGLGVVDLHLLGSARLTPGVRLWTRDRRLAAAALDLGVGWRQR